MATQESWEFLLQQEGDQSWLPLESPDVEILEGRYRIIARSDHKNADLEVRIAHETILETPPKRRIQKRSARSNRDGFILIMPFTLLQPGLWEISCMGDVMAELLGEHWQQAIQLHVLPKEMEEIGDWAWDWQQPTPIPTVPDLEPLRPTATKPLPPVAAETLPEMAATAPQIADLPPETLSHNHDDDRAELPPAPAQPIDTSDASPSPQPQSEPLAELSLEWMSSDTPNETDRSEADLLELDELLGWEQPNSTMASTPAAMDQFDVWLEAGNSLTPAAPSHPDEMPDETNRGADQFDVWMEELNQLAAVAPPLPAVVHADLPLEDRLTKEGAGSPGSADVDWDQALAASIEPPPDLTADRSRDLSGHQTGERSSHPSSPIPPQAEEAGQPNEPVRASGLPPLQVRLQPDIYTFTRQSPSHQANLTLSGRIQTDGTRAILPQGELVITLRDPETSAVVVEQRQSLLQQPLPMDLAASLALPQDCQAQLLLGEVVLWDDGVEELAQQSFTATAAVEELLAVTQPRHDIAAASATPSSTAAASASLDLSFLQWVGSVPPPLPPPAPGPPRESHKGVDLPRFSTTSRPSDSTPEPSEGPDLGELELDFLSNPSALSGWTLQDWAMPTMPVVEPLSVESLSDRAAPVPPDEPVVVDWWSLAETDSAPSDEAADRGQQPEPTPFIAAAVPAEPLSTDDREPDAAEPSPQARAAWEFLPAFQVESEPKEVVVDEVPVIPASLKPARVVEPNPLLLPADEPVPVPILKVESSELVVGHTTLVKVQLPDILPKLYVKLWISDRQSRTLLEGPHWLVDFTPNGLGQREATTRLMVPFGSLDLQIGAITIEAATKRESYRTTVNRSAVPPGLIEAYGELDGV